METFLLIFMVKVKVKVLVAQSCQLLVTPRTVAQQAPLPMEFSRQECWSGLLFPSPGALPDPGIEPGSPALQADFSPSEPPIIHTLFHKNFVNLGKPLLPLLISLCSDL